MSSDGYPSAVTALATMGVIANICHWQAVTLPELTLSWWEREANVEAHWYPSLSDSNEPIEPLVAVVTDAFAQTGDVMSENDVAFSYETTLHGAVVRFTIHK